MLTRGLDSTGKQPAGLIIALLPALAALGEFVWRMHRLCSIAFFWACGAVLCAAWHNWREVRASAAQEGGAEPEACKTPPARPGLQAAAGLLAVAVFTAGFLGLHELLFGLGAGALGKDIMLPLDPDVFYYSLGLLLWLAAYGFLRRSAPGRLDYFLGWRWRLADLPIALGLGALTWAGLTLYLKYNAAAHPPMDIFGVAPGSVAPWLYLALGLVFTAANAFMEELWFRGLLLPGLAVLLRPWPAALLCGLVFGITHWFGTPRGVLGLLLAGGWGVLLSYWTLARKSLWPALSVHLLADYLIWLRTN